MENPDRDFVDTEQDDAQAGADARADDDAASDDAETPSEDA